MSSIPTAQIPVMQARAVRRAEAWSPAARRLVAAAVVVGCTMVLGLAAWIEPSPTGLGSHEQLGVPACGWIAIADLPCPTCGMTTAFAHAADGRVLTGIAVQPLGGILAIGVGMAWLVGVYVMITGSRLAGALLRLWRARTGWALSAAVVLAWLYKIATYKGWI